MKISLNWIKEFVDIPAKYSAKHLAELLTMRTCEVENYEDQKLKFANMVAGKVVNLRPHPNADKLRLADTDIGGRIVQIVCGGTNLSPNMLVAVALPGAQVNWHGAGETVELKETKIRGEISFGMICAGEEIGFMPSAPSHIMDLDTFLSSRGLASAKPGTALAEVLHLDDVIFEIDNKSLTHRPDLWGNYGMAREFAAFLGKKLKKINPKISFPKTGQSVKIKFAKPNIAARFLSTIITGIRIEDSPEWLKKRLEAIGMRPQCNIVDITNYVMHELGHPMHAFDRRTLKNDGFLIRFAKRGEVAITLDHKKRELAPEDALVTSGEDILAIAGIMGGLNSEITAKTEEIVLEVASWNPVMIRKTSQRLGLRTDSSQRFEKSLDPEIAMLTFRRACELILKICKGAKLAGPAADTYLNKPNSVSVLLNTDRINKKIGVDISEKEMAEYLKALEFGVNKTGKNILKVKVPTFRATKDINIEDDLTEEIARMHGYENIPAKLPMLPVKLPIENRERALKHKARQILSFALGFTEANHYSFYGISEIKKCGLPQDIHIMIDNPFTDDQTYMRASLLPDLLKSAELNLRNRSAFKLYEIGRTYIKNDAYFPMEEKFICGVVVKSKSGKEIFYDALGAAQNFLKLINARNLSAGKAEKAPPYAHPSKCAAIKCRIRGQETEIALIYEIHPQVPANFYINAEIAAFEINFSRLISAAEIKLPMYKPIPRYPGIEIDVSVLVHKRTPVREIQELISKSNQNLIAGVSLIDIFENKSLGEGKKSFTFRVLLQSADRTLTDEEMKEIQKNIFKTLQDSGFSIRGI